MRSSFSKLLVLLFAAFFTVFAFAAFDKQNKQRNDVVDKAMSDPNLTTLVIAIQKADLTDTLKSKGPFTLFAPSNEAFAKIPKDQLDKLLSDKKRLKEVLTYHLVEDKLPERKLKDGEVVTVVGEKIIIDKNAKGVTVNEAKVTEADIYASNGVVHIIDTVLIPGDEKKKM